MGITQSLRPMFAALVILPLPLMSQAQESTLTEAKPDISEHVMTAAGRFNSRYCLPPEAFQNGLINRYEETELIAQAELHPGSGLSAGIVREPTDRNEDGKITASFFAGTPEMVCLIAAATVVLDEANNGEDLELEAFDFKMLYQTGNPFQSFFVPSKEGICFKRGTTETAEGTAARAQDIIEHGLLETDGVSIGLYQKRDSENAFLMVADSNEEVACLTAIFTPPQPDTIPINYLAAPDDSATFQPDPL